MTAKSLRVPCRHCPKQNNLHHFSVRCGSVTSVRGFTVFRDASRPERKDGYNHTKILALNRMNSAHNSPATTVKRTVILVANSKGGCGKTTIATNLVSYYEALGRPVTLLDLDPQQSATQWLKLRKSPHIHGLAWPVSEPLSLGRLQQKLDQAGELGAKGIYAGQMAVLKDQPCAPLLSEMAAQEAESGDLIPAVERYVAWLRRDIDPEPGGGATVV